MIGFGLTLPTWLKWGSKTPISSTNTNPQPKTLKGPASPYTPTFVGTASDANKAIEELGRKVDAAKDSKNAIDVSGIEMARFKTIQQMARLAWMAQEEENRNFASQCLMGDLNSSFMIVLKACDAELSRQKESGTT